MRQKEEQQQNARYKILTSKQGVKQQIAGQNKHTDHFNVEKEIFIV